MPEEPYAESAAKSANDSQPDSRPPSGWTIIAESTGGDDLHDCQIIKVAAGPPTEYEFIGPEGHTLSKSTIFPPVFKDFKHLGKRWTVSVRTNLTQDPKFVFGSWHNPNTAEAASDPGEWTAQSGIGPIGAKAASADAS